MPCMENKNRSSCPVTWNTCNISQPVTVSVQPSVDPWNRCSTTIPIAHQSYLGELSIILYKQGSTCNIVVSGIFGKQMKFAQSKAQLQCMQSQGREYTNLINFQILMITFARFARYLFFLDLDFELGSIKNKMLGAVQ